MEKVSFQGAVALSRGLRQPLKAAGQVYLRVHSQSAESRMLQHPSADSRGPGSDVEASTDDATTSIVLRQLPLLSECGLHWHFQFEEQLPNLKVDAQLRIVQGGEAEGAVVDADVPIRTCHGLCKLRKPTGKDWSARLCSRYGSQLTSQLWPRVCQAPWLSMGKLMQAQIWGLALLVRLAFPDARRSCRCEPQFKWHVAHSSSIVRPRDLRIAFSAILARQGRRGILFAATTQFYGISLYILAPLAAKLACLQNRNPDLTPIIAGLLCVVGVVCDGLGIFVGEIS